MGDERQMRVPCPPVDVSGRVMLNLTGTGHGEHTCNDT